MRSARSIPTVIAVAAGLMLPTFTPSHADKAGAAIAGGITGPAAGAAIANEFHSHKEDKFYPGYQSMFFSPKRGINCYPAQRACYSAYNGDFAPKWTRKLYGN